MNSPPDAVSPSPSTPSSGTPPPDEGIPHLTPPVPVQQLPSPSLSKRRLVSAGNSHGRDLKSRRREDTSSKKPVNQDHNIREGRKDELLDIDLMDKLKLELGDPFDES